MSQAALVLARVAHRFRRRWVLRGIDLTVAGGEVVALVGRNGSGKTTLLRICATLLRPSRGGGRLFGADLVEDASRLRGRIGWLGHSPGLYPDLTADENLRFAQRMRDGAVSPGAIERVLADVGLGTERDERVRGFSAGMRRRLALARLMLFSPALLLLDEPYASFDVDGVDRVNSFAAAVAAAGGIVLVATHDVARGAGAIGRIVHIEDGLAADALESEPGAVGA